MNWTDILIFGAIAFFIVINTLHGIFKLLCWIWKKVKTWKLNIK